MSGGGMYGASTDWPLVIGASFVTAALAAGAIGGVAWWLTGQAIAQWNTSAAKYYTEACTERWQPRETKLTSNWECLVKIDSTWWPERFVVHQVKP